MRLNWCMTFESFNQIIKNIAQGSNYKNVTKRCLHVYSLRSARALVLGVTAEWGAAMPCYVGSALQLKRGEVDALGSDILLDAFDFVPEHVCELEFIHISSLRHLGDCFKAHNSWVVHEPLQGDLAPALAQVHHIFEITGDTHYGAIIIELYRHTDISLSVLDNGVVMQVPVEDLTGGTRHLVLLESHMLTPLKSFEANGARHFLFDR